jgi:hypothetical protein
MNISDKVRIKFHDWSSVESRDLNERYKIMEILKNVPLNELSELFKEMKPESVESLIHLIQAMKRSKS